ncbi:MAG TPA: hypothetical protein ENJ00_10520 [Phycisphaerales bacterium]|nr:hypothetical protein [Phycisphaerales bacterium]
MKRIPLPIFAVLAALMLPLAGARAQTQDETFAAHELARLAMIDLRTQTEATPADYAITADLLRIALDISPNDTILLRRLIEAERATGNEQGVLQATRRLIRLDPSDTVAQLRLLSWSISQKQTVQERIELYDRFLGPEGERAIPDPAVRSRLALDEALLLREQGDERRFIERLSLATSLDSSNKEAAALASAFFSERNPDPVGGLELAINVLRADPIDPNLHFAVAGVLVRHGVFDQAQRFHDNGRRLLAADGVSGNKKVETESILLRWQTQGAEVILAEFERFLQLQREAAAQRIAQLTEAGQPTDNVKSPDEIRLPVHSERLRTMAAAAVGDRVIIERSLKDLKDGLDPQLKAIAERMKTPGVQEDPELQAALSQQAVSYAVELIVSRLVANMDIPKVTGDSAQIRPLFSQTSPEQMAAIDAMVLYRRHNVEQAMPLLKQNADVSTLGAVFYGIASEEQGDPESAAEAYARTARFSPLSALGAFARTRYELIKGEPLVFSEYSESIRKVAEAVPDWIDVMTADPRRYMSLSIAFERSRIEPYESPILNVTIRNTSPIALAVGSDRPINSRLMLSEGMDIASIPSGQALSPEVADIQTRLRLTPGESMTARIWPNPGFSGFLAEVKSTHRIRSRWNILQGFVVGKGTLYSSGPMCLSGETGLLVREPDLMVRRSVDDLARQVELFDEDRFILLLGSLRAAILDVDRPGGALSDSDTVRLSEIIAGRYPTLSPKARLAVIAVMPTAMMRPSMQKLDDTILAETEPKILAAALVSRVTTADAPALKRALASQDPLLREVAETLASRVGDGAGYAFMKPPGSFRPPSPEHPEAIQP